MITCTGCHRHHRTSESSCPFCGASAPSVASRAFQVMASGVTMVVLAACYGSGFKDFETGDTSRCSGAECDVDTDGYTVGEGDCNDANPDIHPDATEICDDAIDNNCDSLTDSADTVGCP